jgi:hypothetical protein
MGWMSMTETLQRDPRFKDRPIRVHNYALAGYKEPQQAAMLSYLFAMGQRPDAVVNLDGFNEAALGWHNARLGTNPLYPHVPHWAETGSNMRSDGDMLEYLYDVRTKQLRARSFGQWFLGSGLWRSCFLDHVGFSQLERLRRNYVGAYGKLTDQIMNGPKDVGVRADEERALRDRPAHDLPRPFEDVLLGEARLQLAPDVDALDQRAGLVPARLAGRERRIEMQMAVDERRRDEPAVRRDLLRAVGGKRLADRGPALVLGEEVDEPPVEQAGVADDEAHARESTGR